MKRRIPFAFTIVVPVLLFSLAEQGNAGTGTSRTFVFGNSSYTFYKNSVAQKRHWTESRQRCKDTGSDLVSIESKKEWRFLKKTIQRMNTIEYYIGLRKDSTSGEWKWISDNSKVNATIGKFPWTEYEPSGDGNCANMYKHYRGDYGLFNDLPCYKQEKYSGYICESPTKRTDQEAPTVGKTLVRTEGDTGTKTTLRQSFGVTSAAPLTPSTRSSREALSKEATSQTERGDKESGTNPTLRQSTSSKYFFTRSNPEAIPSKDVKDVPIEDTTKNNTKVIVIVLTLLALLILITLIVFYVMDVRRRNFKKQDARNTTDARDQLDNQDGSSLSPENVSRELGFSKEAEPCDMRRENQKRETHQSSIQEGGYAMLTHRAMMVSGDTSYASLEKSKQGNCINESSVAASPLLQHDDEHHDELPTYVNMRSANYGNI